jgi:effector-binding domain-containing protein
MIDEPQIVQTAAQQAAVIHVIVPRDKIREVMGPGYSELMESLAAQGVTPLGPWFTHHFKMDPDTFDFEIGVPVAAPVKPAGRMKAGQLPAAKVARTVYHGPYEGLPGGWGQFDEWIKNNGHDSGPGLWEVYTVGPESGSDSSKWRTELNRPLAS